MPGPLVKETVHVNTSKAVGLPCRALPDPPPSRRRRTGRVIPWMVAPLLLVEPQMLAAAPGRTEPLAAQEATPASRRAHVRWERSGENRRKFVYADGVKHVSAAGEEATWAFVGNLSCPARTRAPVGARSTCIGAARGKVVSDAAFEMDPGMSTAHLDIRLLNRRHVVDWMGEGTPEGGAESPEEGEPTVYAARSSTASGEVFGRRRDAERSEAELRTEQTYGAEEPPQGAADPGAPGVFGAAGSGMQQQQAAADGLCGPVTDAEREFRSLTNQARTAQGKRRLRLDPELTRVARLHANEMAERDLLHHQPSGAFGRRVTRWKTLGENVGVGTGVDAIQRAFLASPLHRKNIMLSGFRHIGVGVNQDGVRLWVTVIFESRRDPGTKVSC